MLSAELRLAKAMMGMRIEQTLRRTESHNLLRQAGPRQQGWFSLQSHQLAQRVAYLLVATGARLVRYGLPPYYPAEGRAS